MILVSWLGLFGFLVVTQAKKGFDADSVGGVCVMALITLMLVRGLYRARCSRRAG